MGQVILIVGLWACCSCWSAQLFLLGFGRAFRQMGQAGADSGGLYPIVLRHNVSQCLDQGQWVGKCLVASGELPARRLGGRVYIVTAALRELAAS